MLGETSVLGQAGSWDLSMEGRFQLIVNVYRQLRNNYERGIKVSEDEEGNSTNDLSIVYHIVVEKGIRTMLAEPDKKPGEGE